MKDISVYTYCYKNKLTEDEINFFSSCLSKFEIEKARSFKKRCDQDISLLSRYLLRNIISNYIDIKPEEIIFMHNSFNRPYLDSIDFNVSHSGDWIVIAINQEGRVGADVERMRDVDEKLVEICFTEEEKKHLFDDNGILIEKFFELWTLKESFIKAYGTGLSLPLKDFYFTIDDEIKINFNNNDIKGNWYFFHLNICPGYKFSLCSDIEIQNPKVKLIKDIKTFLNEKQ